MWVDVIGKMNVTSVPDCRLHVLEDLRSVKSYIWPLFHFHPKLFLRKRTLVPFYLSWCTKFPSFPFFWLSKYTVYQGLFLYHLSLFSSKILVLFYWADVVKLRIFQPQGSDEMFTMLFYKYNEVYYYSTFVRHPQVAGC